MLFRDGLSVFPVSRYRSLHAAFKLVKFFQSTVVQGTDIYNIYICISTYVHIYIYRYARVASTHELSFLCIILVNDLGFYYYSAIYPGSTAVGAPLRFVLHSGHESFI